MRSDPYQQWPDRLLNLGVEFRHLLIGVVGHHPSGSLNRFEKYVAGESVGDDHVRFVDRDVPAFDVADETNPALFKKFVGGPLESATFALFLADGQQTDPGILHPQERPTSETAHDRELEELLRLHVRVRAHVEHHRGSSRSGKHADDGWPGNPLDPPDDNRRGSHRGAG